MTLILSPIIYSVYGLNCPINNIFRWIGMSEGVQTRYKQHLNDKYVKEKREWVLKLKDKGLKPELIILYESENKRDVLDIEAKLILKHKSTLYNLNKRNDKHRRPSNRSIKTFSITDEDLYAKFKAYCISKNISMSERIMEHMAEYVKENQPIKT